MKSNKLEPVVCPHCGKENEGDASFCIHCGGSFSEPIPLKAEPMKPCPICGKGNEETAMFCIYCGGSLVEKEVPKVEEVATKICPGCGKENAEGALFCSGCGYSFSEKVDRRVEEAPLNVCPECGEENNEEAMFCGVCGHSLRDPSEKGKGTKKEIRFEDMGQQVGKKVDALAKSGNAKVKNFADSMDDEKTIEYSKTAYIISAVVAVIAPFLPYLSFQMFGRTMRFNYMMISAEIIGGGNLWLDGVMIVFLGALAILFWRLDEKMAMLAVGAASAFFGLLESIQLYQLRSFSGLDLGQLNQYFDGQLGANFAKVGIGFYLSVLACFGLLIASGIYYYKLKDKEN